MIAANFNVLQVLLLATLFYWASAAIPSNCTCYFVYVNANGGSGYYYSGPAFVGYPSNVTSVNVTNGATGGGYLNGNGYFTGYCNTANCGSGSVDGSVTGGFYSGSAYPYVAALTSAGGTYCNSVATNTTCSVFCCYGIEPTGD